MLQVTWAVMFVVCCDHRLYGAWHRVWQCIFSATGINVDLNGLSRSSGVARWAAAPGLVCVLKAFHTRRPALIAFFLAAAGGAFFIVYRMQSRGAVFGLVAALLFALFTSSRLRRYALPCTLLRRAGDSRHGAPAELSARVSELSPSRTNRRAISQYDRADPAYTKTASPHFGMLQSWDAGSGRTA